MPVSEDEYERPVQMGTNPTPLSKAEQRKNNKPIMEKRRRARINHCLNELKTLILDAMKKDPARHSKLEKADILEMTVKHLQQIQRQQLATAVATDPGVIMRFKSGFDECAAEVSRYIGRLEGIDNGVKQRLTAHLHRCVSSLQHISASAFPHQAMFASLAQNCDKSNTIVLPNVASLPGDVNNNSNQNGERIQIPGGLQLIPSRLPTGELALLVPNSNQMSTFLNAPTGATFQFPANTTVSLNTVLSPTLGGSLGSNTSHASAFTAVSKAPDYPSPTSTADIIKIEPSHSEKDNFNSPSYLNRIPESSIHQNYKIKVTNTREIADLQADEHNYKNSKLSLPGHDLTDGSQNYGNSNGFGRKFSEGTDHDLKINQKATLNSFQKNVADSTTSSFQPKDEEIHESGFKSFHVEIPNSHLKAHISLSRPQEHQEMPSPSLRLPTKSNLNFIPNSTKTYHTSSPTTNCNELDYAKSNSLSGAAKDDPKGEMTYPNCAFPMLNSLPRPKDTSPISYKLPDSQGQRSGKRPLSNGSTELCSTTEPCEPNSKMPRISLNVTLTENHQPLSEQSCVENKCKRISVIVEDSSKNFARDNSGGDDNSGSRRMAATGSSQRDMWRPW